MKKQRSGDISSTGRATTERAEAKRAPIDRSPINIAAADRWHNAEDLKWAARSWASRIGVKVPQIFIRQMITKWASISTSGHLTLNSELLNIPRSLGEFVLVHEIVHTLVPNHGMLFKSFLFAYMPDWQERERSLRSLERDQLREK